MRTLQEFTTEARQLRIRRGGGDPFTHYDDGKRKPIDLSAIHKKGNEAAASTEKAKKQREKVNKRANTQNRMDAAGRKDAIYRHAFVYWDKNFDLIKISKQFNFMGADIEFCAGMAIKDDSMLITFGFQDNAAYIVKSPMSLIEEYLHD